VEWSGYHSIFFSSFLPPFFFQNTPHLNPLSLNLLQKSFIYRAYGTVSQLSSSTWDQVEQAAKDSFEKSKDTAQAISPDWSSARENAWTQYLNAKAYTGSTFDDIQDAVKSYYNSAKHTTKQSLDELTNAAWDVYVRAAVSRGESLESVEESARRAYESAIKKSSSSIMGVGGKKAPSLDEFLDTTRQTYERAYKEGVGGHWWNKMGHQVACAWDNAKCRLEEVGHGMKASMAAVGGGGGPAVSDTLKKTHEQVDTLYKEATKVEL